MTDTVKLKKAIEVSGLKKSHIAKQLGISRVSLCNALQGKTEVRESQMQKLASLLSLTDEKKLAIFFARSGG